MGQSRSERRTSSGARFNLYAAEITLGWRVIGQTTGLFAAEKTASGSWHEVYFADGSFAGYQMAAAPGGAKIRPSGALSPSTITRKELEMNAGLWGRSRTRGRPEWKRLERHAKYDREKILAPEDAIELAVEKVRLWPYPASRIDDGSGTPVYGDRAPRVYPPAGKP